MILGSPGALCLAMACSQRSSLLWKLRSHPSKGHSSEAMAGAGGATRRFGGGPSAAGDAGPSAGGTPALRREETRGDRCREDAAQRSRRRRGDEEDRWVGVAVDDEVGFVRKVVGLHLWVRRLR